jgi:Uma2 family endonuclease
MASPARRPTAYDELLALPEHVVGEILNQELHATPRPRGPHIAAHTSLTGLLSSPFGHGRGGPGGWIILDEPEVHLGDDVVVPDLAGWRRERLSKVPATGAFTVAPDWVCEVVSPSTERIDRSIKRDIYAREGIGHLWLVVPLARTVEVYALEAGRWVLLGTHTDQAVVGLPPFDAVPLELGLLWEDVEQVPPEP